MLGKSPNQNQMNLFKPVLKHIINPQDPLVILSSDNLYSVARTAKYHP